MKKVTVHTYESKESPISLSGWQRVTTIPRNLQSLRDFTGLAFEGYYKEGDNNDESTLMAVLFADNSGSLLYPSLLRKRFCIENKSMAGAELFNVMEEHSVEKYKKIAYAIYNINLVEQRVDNTEENPDEDPVDYLDSKNATAINSWDLVDYNADRVIALDNQLSQRNKFLDKQFNQLYATGLEIVKNLELLAEKYIKLIDDQRANLQETVLVGNCILEIFKRYHLFQEVNFTSPENQKKTVELIEKASRATYSIHFRLLKDDFERRHNTPLEKRKCINFLVPINDLFVRVMTDAEKLSSWGVDNLLLKSTEFLKLHSMMINHWPPDVDNDYFQRLQDYMTKRYNDTHETVLLQNSKTLLYVIIFIGYCKNGNFQAALENYDGMINDYKSSRGMDEWVLNNVLFMNNTHMIPFFNDLLSRHILPVVNIIERAQYYLILVNKYLETNKFDKKGTHIKGVPITVPLETQINLKNAHSQQITNLQQSLKKFIADNEKNIRKSKKNQRKKAKAKEKNQQLKPPATSAVTLEDKRELPPLPKAVSSTSQPADVLPPPPLVTVRISDAEIHRGKEIKINQFHANTHKSRKNKKSVDMKEPQTEETVYELKAHTAGEKVKAMIASHLLKTLPIDLALAAIEILSSGWIGARKDEVQPVTPDDRKRYNLSPRATHQIIVTSKEDNRMNETYRIFAKRGLHKNERYLIFDQIVPKVK